MSDDENRLTCPYCGTEQYTHEPDDFSAYACCTECESCGKLFWYSVWVTREYTPFTDEELENSRKANNDNPEMLEGGGEE